MSHKLLLTGWLFCCSTGWLSAQDVNTRERYLITVDSLDRPRHIRYVQKADTVLALPDTLRPVATSRPKKRRTTFTFCCLRAGDTLQVNVIQPDGKAFREVSLSRADGEVLQALENWPEFRHEQVVKLPAMETDSAHPVQHQELYAGDTIHLSIHRKASLPFFNRAFPQFQVIRRPGRRTDQYYVVYDTLFSMVSRPAPGSGDTLFIPLKDDSLRVAPFLDFEGSSLSMMEILIPKEQTKKDRLMAMAFWIGATARAKEAYAEQEALMTDAWDHPEVTPPLGAFSTGRRATLPDAGTEDLVFAFLGRQASRPFVREVTRGQIPGGMIDLSPRHPNYQLVPASVLEDRGCFEFDPEQGRSFCRLFLYLYNTSKVNTYQVNVKALGLYLSEEYVRGLEVLQAVTYEKRP